MRNKKAKKLRRLAYSMATQKVNMLQRKNGTESYREGSPRKIYQQLKKGA